MDKQSLDKFADWFNAEWIKGAGKYSLTGTNTEWVSGLIARDMITVAQNMFTDLVKRQFEVFLTEMKRDNGSGSN